MEKKINDSIGSSEKPMSLYDFISEAVVDGCLPERFSLPQSPDDGQIRWMDGALDGVNIYHMGFSDMTDENKTLMSKAVSAASEKNFDEADRLFCELGKDARAIAIIDELQSYILDHRTELSAGNIYEYAVHAIMNSSDRECVKCGLSLLELFNTDDNEELKNVIRTLGLSDEFSIFVIFVMLRWKDGNNEVYQLAHKIHGWGRVHAIERIEPETDEIRDWLLKDGVHNTILPAYSALTCWQKSNAESVLKGSPSRKEFSGIRDIIRGLLDEGPVSGISEIEDSAEMIAAFLNQARRIELNLEDYEAIWDIYTHYENSQNASIDSLCQGILASDECKNAVREAVKEGRSIVLAQRLQVEYKADVLRLLKTEFDGKFHLCNLLMGDAEYQSEVLDIFRQNLPLDEMKTYLTDSHGLGEEYKRQRQLESLVQELRRYPLEGIDFVETALQSAPVRTRNFGISALEEWVSAKKVPLKELMPDTYNLLSRLREIEVRDDVKKKMDRLIAGTITFTDAPKDAEDV